MNISLLKDNIHLPGRDEYQVQYLLLNEPGTREDAIDWLDKHKPDTSIKSTEKSKRHREEGNRLFRANKRQNALEASRCYTNAIISAPSGSRELALAHANRSASIAELGYHKEAFEDCECAIENGYPSEMMEKLITRQTSCASKLEDYDKLNACVDKLNAMVLGKVYEKQKSVFQEDLIRLKEARESVGGKSITEKYVRQEILCAPEKGRYLTASNDIAEGEVVLTEKAFAFVPVGECVRICQNCAAQHMIPFPCNACARVFYCSLHCKAAHEATHAYECFAYRCGHIPTFGIAHLAMSILLKGLPSIWDHLKPCKDGEDIWRTIEEISSSADEGYAEVLSLVTHFEETQRSRPHIFHGYLSCTNLAAMYLRRHTSFFDMFEGSACSQQQWLVVTAALLLRHALQITYNASTSSELSPLNDSSEFRLLSGVWEKANHFSRGELHEISRVGQTYAGIFPHLAVCNHSCDPSFSPKFDGSCVAVFARHQLEKGAEIFNSYVPQYRVCSKDTRKRDLKETYNFECSCKFCSDEYGDEAYLQFYRYRCQNGKCKCVFVPQLKNQDWWLQEGETASLTCPKCQSELNLDWFWHFDNLAAWTNDTSKVLQLLKSSERFLVGHSELRSFMCESAALAFFKSWKKGAQLTNAEFTAIGDAVAYLLDVIEQKNGVKCILYIAKATFALDLMALEKYFNFDCAKIQTSLDMLSMEMRSVFDNYIGDFIGDKFLANRAKF